MKGILVLHDRQTYVSVSIGCPPQISHCGGYSKSRMLFFSRANTVIAHTFVYRFTANVYSLIGVSLIGALSIASAFSDSGDPGIITSTYLIELNGTK